jgi:hypothetical protein
MSNVIGPINQSDWLDMQRAKAGVKQALSLPSDKYETIQEEFRTHYKSLKDKYICA